MKIIIADDEQLIRTSLRIKIEKISNTDILITEAYDSDDFILKIKQAQYDIAFVDVKMPGKTGLEAIKCAMDISPETAFYVLTGFSEFEYSKQAIKLGVKDYLLKPIPLEDIKRIIEHEMMEKSNLIQKNKDMLFNYFQSISNNIDYKTSQSMYLSFFFIDCDSTKYDVNIFINGIIKSMEEAGITIYAHTEYKLRNIVSYSNISIGVMDDFINRMTATPLPRFITLYYSTPSKSMHDMNILFKSAHKMSTARVFMGIGKYNCIMDEVSYDNILYKFSEYCENMLYNIFSSDFINFEKEVKLCSHYYFENKINAFSEYKKNIFQFFICSLSTDISLLHNPEEMSKTLVEKNKEQFSHIKQPSKFEEIIDYVHSNFCNEISLESVAEVFSLSMNYFSSAFKAKTNKTFIKYLNDLRINHAKSLLLTTSVPIKDISKQCGYFSQSYFGKLFVSYEGITPAKYRSQFQSVK